MPTGTVAATFTPTGTPAGTVSPTVTPTCEPCGDSQIGPCEQCDDGNTLAGGPGSSACHAFDDDRTWCLAAFHAGMCGVSSCYWNGGSCGGCGPSNELEGLCFNTCEAP